MNKNDILRNIPSVDEALSFPGIKELTDKIYRPIILEGIREEIKEYRQMILSLSEEDAGNFSR